MKTCEVLLEIYNTILETYFDKEIRVKSGFESKLIFVMWEVSRNKNEEK